MSRKIEPQKRLITTLKKRSGRDFSGKVVVRHQGGGAKQKVRTIDTRGKKIGVSAVVASIEYDPTRTARLALLHYEDGIKSYIICPEGLKVGDKLMAGSEAEAKLGNNLPLEIIPIGLPIHNIELTLGKGGQICRSAGSSATILSKEGGFAAIKLPSGEVRRVPLACSATIGQVGNVEWKNVKFGKAGKKFWRGIKPTVRGVAQNPNSHPHGGGEGRSGIGMPSPKTPWGKPTLGKRTRKHGKYSDKYIIKRRP
jgi:large subunit ribosomal protein L2